MFYRILELKPDLLFIQWFPNPQPDAHHEAEYVADLAARLDGAPAPLYFISDLRHGQITDVVMLQKLGHLTHHRNYGAGAAFSQDLISKLYVGVFSRFASVEKGMSVFYAKMEDALAYLEAHKSGVTADVDWARFHEQVV